MSRYAYLGALGGGSLRVVATRRLSRCGPVWRATNPALDATAVVLPASALRHTPRGRRNHRPRRGVRRPRPVASGVDHSAARSLKFSSIHTFLCFLGSPSSAAKKKEKEFINKVGTRLRAGLAGISLFRVHTCKVFPEDNC